LELRPDWSGREVFCVDLLRNVAELTAAETQRRAPRGRLLPRYFDVRTSPQDSCEALVRWQVGRVTWSLRLPLDFLLAGTMVIVDRLCSGTKEGCTEMSRHAEACIAHAAQCIKVAEKTCTAEDREFLTFADAWERLATEIEQ
jgi:hypothetical protein